MLRNRVDFVYCVPRWNRIFHILYLFFASNKLRPRPRLMGIKGLTSLIQEHAPKAIKVHLRVLDTSYFTADALGLERSMTLKHCLGVKSRLTRR